MVFTKEDNVVIIIKFLRETKHYGAKRFLSEFPTKPWSLSGQKRLIKKTDNIGSASKQRGKNWTSALSILQSGSGALAFMHVSRQKATTLSTSCFD